MNDESEIDRLRREMTDLRTPLEKMEHGHQYLATARERMVQDAQKLENRVENIEDHLHLSGRHRK